MLSRCAPVEIGCSGFRVKKFSPRRHRVRRVRRNVYQKLLLGVLGASAVQSLVQLNAKVSMREYLIVSNLGFGILSVGRKQKVLLLAKPVEILRLPDSSLRCRRRFGSTLARLVQVRQRRQTPADRRKAALGYLEASRKTRNRRVPLPHSRLPRLDGCAE